MAARRGFEPPSTSIQLPSNLLLDFTSEQRYLVALETTCCEVPLPTSLRQLCDAPTYYERVVAVTIRIEGSKIKPESFGQSKAQ